MAISLIGAASTATFGVASAELGVRIATFSLTVTPEIDVPFIGLDGQQDGAAIGDPMGDLEMSGETLDISTGALAGNFHTAFVPANTANYFGRSAGGFYLKKGEITLDRGVFRKFSTSHKSHFNLA
jgi:hypothetical protein